MRRPREYWEREQLAMSLAALVVWFTVLGAGAIFFSGCAGHQRFNRVEHRIAAEHAASERYTHEETLHAVHIRGIHSLSAGEVGTMGLLEGVNGVPLYARRFSGGLTAKGHMAGSSRTAVVGSGQTLYGILVQQYGVATPALIAHTLELNPGLRVNALAPGTVLTLP